MVKFNKLRKKKWQLYVSPGESVRDAIIKSGLKAAEESGYVAGNRTEWLVNIASRAGTTLDRATEVALGTESAGALGRVTFKATKDITRGNTVCTGRCLVSVTCEAVALC